MDTISLLSHFQRIEVLLLHVMPERDESLGLIVRIVWLPNYKYG